MSDQKLETTAQKASYGIGLQMGQQLARTGLKGLDAQAIAAGISTILEGNKPAISIDAINAALSDFHQEAEAAQQAAAKAAAAEGEEFLKTNAARDEVTVTASGLQYEVLSEGSGKVPSASDHVRVHYHGQLVNGTVFDSSIDRGEPTEFPVNGVIKGWTEALKLMPVGSKWKLFIPQNLAYGERGAGGSIPPFSALIFEVELLAIL